MTELVSAGDLVRHGRETIAVGSKSFAMASRVLEPAIRDDAAMLYAFCRYADDLVDGQVMGHGQLKDYKAGQARRVIELREGTLQALAGVPQSDPHYAGLVSVVRKHDVPHAHVMELIDGFQMDADDRVYESVQDVLDYGYHVAGVVGVMMAWIMGVRDASTLDRASDLGIAFQLTNIARDIVDDAVAGRVFVPRDVLEAVGAPMDAVGLRDRAKGEATFRAATVLLDEAEPYYASARVGVAELSKRNSWAILTALRVYRAIGTTLRKGGPDSLFSRTSTTKLQKLGLAASAWSDARRRAEFSPVSRAGLYARP